MDLRQVPELLLDTRKQDTSGSWARLRVGVVERLLGAQRSLPPDVRLLVVEGHRPAALQQRYFHRHRTDLGRAHPEWAPGRLDIEASKYVSPPAVAPHPCGAAVDLTLSRDGRELDLGTAVNATPDNSANACFTAADNISATARRWRQVMTAALSATELVNYPSEWWHWSYGDRYWAAATDAPLRHLHAPLTASPAFQVLIRLHVSVRSRLFCGVTPICLVGCPPPERRPGPAVHGVDPRRIER